MLGSVPAVHRGDPHFACYLMNKHMAFGIPHALLSLHVGIMGYFADSVLSTEAVDFGRLRFSCLAYSSDDLRGRNATAFESSVFVET